MFPSLLFLLGICSCSPVIIDDRIHKLGLMVLNRLFTVKGPPVQRKPLKHRDYEVDLESRLGKTQVSLAILSLFLETLS